jgi:hypothetical protein
LPGAHDINFKQTRQSGRESFRYWRFRRPVKIAGIIRPFEQLTFDGHLLKLVFADKKILPAVDLAGARRSGRYRD